MESRSKRNIQQFNGERYSTWKFRVRSLLGELQVLCVIDELPPSNPDEEWKRKNMLAKGTIVEYLGDAFLNFAKGSATAKSIMDDLDKVYERRSLATQLALRKQLLNLKLQPDVTLFQHFNNFDNIITDLISAGAKLDEMDKVSHLLLTLPSSYDGVITALETLGEEQLNLAFVKTRLLDHEVKLKADTTTELKVLQASAKKFTSRSGFDKKKYRENTQYKKKPHPGNSRHKISKLHCDYCGRRNHVKKDCYYYKKIQQDSGSSNQTPTANTMQISGNDEDSFAFMFTTCASTLQLAVFSGEHWNTDKWTLLLSCCDSSQLADGAAVAIIFNNVAALKKILATGRCNTHIPTTLTGKTLELLAKGYKLTHLMNLPTIQNYNEHVSTMSPRVSRQDRTEPATLSPYHAHRNLSPSVARFFQQTASQSSLSPSRRGVLLTSSPTTDADSSS